MNGTDPSAATIAALSTLPPQPSAARRTQRNLALDSLRIALAAMVVGLHAKFLIDVDEPLGDFLQNHLFRIAVPVFFVINGYYFAAIFEGRQPARPWALRISALYLLWSAVYGAQILRSGGDAVGVLKLLVLGYYHLWYLPATLLAGLCLLALRRVAPARLAGSMMLAYAAGCAVQYAANLHLFGAGALDAFVGKTWLHRNFLLMGFPLVGLGLLIARHDLARRTSWRDAALLTAAGALALLLEFGLKRAAGLDAAAPFDILLALPPLCAGLFLLALKAPWTTTNRHLVDLATALYFAHLMFLLHVPAALAGAGSIGTTAWALGATLVVAPLLIWLNARTNRWFL